MINKLNLLKFHEDKSIGLLKDRDDSGQSILIPPFDLGGKRMASIPGKKDDQEEMEPIAGFPDYESLRLFLKYKNAMFVGHQIPLFLKTDSIRPETITDLEKLYDFLTSTTRQEIEKASITAKTARKIQFIRTLFGDEEFSRTTLMESHEFNRLANDEAKEISLVMAGHEPFDFHRWMVPALTEIEYDWVRQKRFQDIQNWMIFSTKFLHLSLSDQNTKKLYDLYKRTAKMARIQKFVKDGRHKIEDWQKPFRAGPR